MKSNRIALALPLILIIGIAPAHAVNKDLIELQTQVTQLQQQMTAMKQSFDERMGVMKNLLEQNTDAANKVTTAINGLQASVNKQQQDRAGQVDCSHVRSHRFAISGHAAGLAHADVDPDRYENHREHVPLRDERTPTAG